MSDSGGPVWLSGALVARLWALRSSHCTFVRIILCFVWCMRRGGVCRGAAHGTLGERSRVAWHLAHPNGGGSCVEQQGEDAAAPIDPPVENEAPEGDDGPEEAADGSDGSNDDNGSDDDDDDDDDDDGEEGEV